MLIPGPRTAPKCGAVDKPLLMRWRDCAGELTEREAEEAVACSGESCTRGSRQSRRRSWVWKETGFDNGNEQT